MFRLRQSQHVYWGNAEQVATYRGQQVAIVSVTVPAVLAVIHAVV